MVFNVDVLFRAQALCLALAVGLGSKMGDYHRLAGFMGQYPEVALFRRFNSLRASNLLYLQAELVSLEKDLRTYAQQDEQSQDELRKMYSKDWSVLSQPNSEGCHGHQWQIILRIRAMLKEYSK